MADERQRKIDAYKKEFNVAKLSAKYYDKYYYSSIIIKNILLIISGIFAFVAVVFFDEHFARWLVLVDGILCVVVVGIEFYQNVADFHIQRIQFEFIADIYEKIIIKAEQKHQNTRIQGFMPIRVDTDVDLDLEFNIIKNYKIGKVPKHIKKKVYGE